MEQETECSQPTRSEKEDGKTECLNDCLGNQRSDGQPSESCDTKHPDPFIQALCRDNIRDECECSCETDGQPNTVQESDEDEGEIKVGKITLKEKVCKGQEAHCKTADGVASLPPHTVDHLRDPGTA